MTPAEPPDSWPVWGELAGIAAVGFVFGILVGYARASRAQRKAVNDYVTEAVFDGTRTVLAVLRVKFTGWNEEIEQGLIDDDFVQEAIVMDDRRRSSIPVQKDRRGTHQRHDIHVPEQDKRRAF